MGLSIPKFLRLIAADLTRRRAGLSWTALALSLMCQVAGGFLGSMGGAGMPFGRPSSFAVALGSSVVLTLAMFMVRKKKAFRLLLLPRVLCLGALLSSGLRALDMIFTAPLLMEIAIAEPFPVNLGLCGLGIIASAATDLLVRSGEAGGRLLAGLAFFRADWFVVSCLFSIAACLMLHYRERMLQLERERRRLDLAVGELASANLGYQEHATVLEQRTMLEERKRITREIHDIIGYTLTNNIMMMEAAVEMVRRDPARVSELINEARRNAEEGLDSIRNALYLLRAQEDPRLAGIDLIARLVSNFRAATGVTVRLEYGNAANRIDRETEAVLYHVIQEALTNSFRHGRATLVEILFWIRDDGTLVVNIRDNGGGTIDIHEGIGVSGMRERVVAVGGSLVLRPGPHGFTVTVEVPLRRERERMAVPGGAP